MRVRLTQEQREMSVITLSSAVFHYYPLHGCSYCTYSNLT